MNFGGWQFQNYVKFCKTENHLPISLADFLHILIIEVWEKKALAKYIPNNECNTANWRPGKNGSGVKIARRALQKNIRCIIFETLQPEGFKTPFICFFFVSENILYLEAIFLVRT